MFPKLKEIRKLIKGLVPENIHLCLLKGIGLCGCWGYVGESQIYRADLKKGKARNGPARTKS